MSPPDEMLADPTHRVRVIAKALFAMAGKECKKHITTADALRLKRNLGYAHKQNRDKPFDEYVKAMWAALYHHFNDHSKCGSWCPWEPAGKQDPAKNEKGVKRSSDNNKWKNCMDVFSTYLTDKHLKQTYHGFDSQKNESVNLKVMTVAPKHKCFSKSRSLEDRVALVVVIDSVGAAAGITRIVEKILDRQHLPPLTQEFLFRSDKEARRKKAYNEKPETKARRAKKIQRQIKKKILEDKKAMRKGLYYCSGVAVAVPGATQTKRKRKKKTTATTASSAAADGAGAGGAGVPVKICKWCGKQGHVRRTHADCDQKLPGSRNSSGGSQNAKDAPNKKTNCDMSDETDGQPLSEKI
jgi:hypothetical protein